MVDYNTSNLRSKIRGSSMDPDNEIKEYKSIDDAAQQFVKHSKPFPHTSVDGTRDIQVEDDADIRRYAYLKAKHPPADTQFAVSPRYYSKAYRLGDLRPNKGSGYYTYIGGNSEVYSPWSMFGDNTKVTAGKKYIIRPDLVPSIKQNTAVAKALVPAAYKSPYSYAGYGLRSEDLANIQANDPTYFFQGYHNALTFPDNYWNFLGARRPIHRKPMLPWVTNYINAANYRPTVSRRGYAGTYYRAPEDYINLSGGLKSAESILSRTSKNNTLMGLNSSEASLDDHQYFDPYSDFGNSYGHEALHSEFVKPKKTPFKPTQLSRADERYAHTTIPLTREDAVAWATQGGYQGYPKELLYHYEPYGISLPEAVQAYSSFNRRLHALKRAVKADRGRYIKAGFEPDKLDRLVSLPTFLTGDDKGLRDFNARMKFFKDNPQFGELLGSEGVRFPTSYWNTHAIATAPPTHPGRRLSIDLNRAMLHYFPKLRVFY